MYKKSYVWDKVNMGLGMYNRGQHEQLLVGKRGSPPMPELENLASSVIRVKRGEHSVKPLQVKSMIEKAHPHTDKIELFARPLPLQRFMPDDWDYWGNEV